MSSCKLKSLEQKLKTHNFKIETNGRMFFVNGPKYVLSWYVQNGLAVCLHVAKHDDKSDLMRDYHAGFFPKTLKSAIEYLQEVES